MCTLRRRNVCCSSIKGRQEIVCFFFLSFLYESSHHLFASLLLPDRHLLMTTHPTHTSSCFCTNHKNGRNKNRELVLFKKCSTFFVSAHKTEKCMKRHQLMVSISFDWKNKKKKKREKIKNDESESIITPQFLYTDRLMIIMIHRKA